MNKRIYTSILALALVTGTVALAIGFNRSLAIAAPSNAAASINAAQTNDLLALLPTTDAVAYVDVRRILTEAIPNLLASNPVKLAQFNAEIEKLKAKTGFDVRSFDRIALGINYSNGSDSVAIARGSFNADALIAAGRLVSNGKFTEQKYNGKTIYNFPITEKSKTAGKPNKVTQLFVTALNANTLAIGMTAATGVRAALDANAGGTRRGASDVATLASRNPNALIGFGGNVPASLAGKADFGNPELTKNIAAIRQVYGFLNSTASNVETLVALLTQTPEQAKSLSDTIGALKQFSGLVVSQAPAAQRATVQSFFDGLQITPQGNEVQIKASVSAANLSTIVGNIK
ncbi:MAG: hypothetical protein ABR577_09035 [Pyrinomonadaceae bacterium]